MRVTQADIEKGLIRLGVQRGMMLEVHCSLSSFGQVDGGAPAVIRALKEAVSAEGAIVMPSFMLSAPLPLDETDARLGVKLRQK